VTSSVACRPIARWSGAFGLALACHAAVVTVVASWRHGESAGATLPAITIDLAPVLQAPQQATADVAPGPIQQALQPKPPEPDPTPAVEPEPEPEPVAESEPVAQPEPPPTPADAVALPIEPPTVVETPKRPEPETLRKPKPRKRTSRRTTASPRPQADAPAIAAPAPGFGNAGSNVATWQSRVAAHLNRHKHYPPAAQAKGETGTVVLAFSIDRDGNVVSASLGRSCGSAALDGEATALARRASPVPPPPPGLGGSRLRLSVPIRFIAH
jgi:protein TonB